MKRKISYGVTLALCVLLILSACGRSTPPKRETPADFLERLEAELTPGTVQNNEAPPQQPDTADPSPVTPQRPGGRLTVLAPGHFRPILQQAARLMEYDRRFELEITTYNPETEADYWAYRLQSMFAAGEGFDLIFADPLFPMWDFARDGYLTEIHELINICSTFNRHDFYEEALQALTVNGELYFFPLGFGFQYIGINSRLPQEFINRFMQYGAITVSQMIDIYTDVLAAGLDLGRDDIWSLGDFMRMTSSRDMSIPGFMALNAVNDFVDIGSGTSNLLDGEFAAFLERMLRLFPACEGIAEELGIRNNLRYNSIARNPLGGMFYNGAPGNMQWFAFDSVFFVSNEFLLPIGAIVPFTVTTAFEGFLPLIDNQGRRISNMGATYPWKMVSIPRGDNDLLAWEFVTQHLVPAGVCYRTNRNMFWAVPGQVYARTNLGVQSFDSPIIRALAEPHFTDVFERTVTAVWAEFLYDADGFRTGYLRGATGLPLAGIHDAPPAEREQTIADAVRRIEEINHSVISPVPLIPIDLFEPTIHLMLRRLTTPEDAAQRIHEAIIQWLSSL